MSKSLWIYGIVLSDNIKLEFIAILKFSIYYYESNLDYYKEYMKQCILESSFYFSFNSYG